MGIRQATLDILDADLRKGYEKYLMHDYEDRMKLLTHSIRIDPYHSEQKLPEIKKYTLKWQELKYSDRSVNLDKVIKSQRKGIYIFFVKPTNTILNMPQYVFYVGISGEGGSERPLKDRLSDYFNLNQIKIRQGLHKILQVYYEHIYIAFSFYNGSFTNLERLETLLHEYYAPKFAKRDFEPKTKDAIKAWAL